MIINEDLHEDVKIMAEEIVRAHLLLDIGGIPRQCSKDEVSENGFDTWTYHCLSWRVHRLLEQKGLERFLDSLDIPKDFEGTTLSLEQRKNIVRTRLSDKTQ